MEATASGLIINQMEPTIETVKLGKRVALFHQPERIQGEILIEIRLPDQLVGTPRKLS